MVRIVFPWNATSKGSKVQSEEMSKLKNPQSMTSTITALPPFSRYNLFAGVES